MNNQKFQSTRRIGPLFVIMAVAAFSLMAAGVVMRDPLTLYVAAGVGAVAFLAFLFGPAIRRALNATATVKDVRHDEPQPTRHGHLIAH
jgi:hypothetical protein